MADQITSEELLSHLDSINLGSRPRPSPPSSNELICRNHATKNLSEKRRRDRLQEAEDVRTILKQARQKYGRHLPDTADTSPLAAVIESDDAATYHP